MTEQEWLSSGDWSALWLYSWNADVLTGRHIRRVMVASCRRFIHRLPHPASLRSLELCERVADGDKEAYFEQRDAYDDAQAAAYSFPPGIFEAAACAAGGLCREDFDKIGRVAGMAPFVHGYEAAIAAGLLSVDSSAEEIEKIGKHPTFLSGVAVGKRIQADLLREVVGNPFRPVTINPAWLTWNDGTVRRIAQTIYDERGFDRMPILADALTDAGCDNEDILNHCRSEGPHVKGCWAVDLILGKE